MDYRCTSRVTSSPLHVVLACAAVVAGCGGKGGPLHRERDPGRDAACKETARPHAFFYPAEDRTDYAPDDPVRDGCALLVADHLFCCPDVGRSTDR